MKKLGAAIGLLACAGLPVAANASEQDGWQFELTPYLWAFGVDGEATVNEYSANFSKDFSDIVENIDGGGSILFVPSYNRFVALLQYDFASIDADVDSLNNRIQQDFPSAKLAADFETTIGTAAVGYRFDTFGEHSWVDVMVGVRQMELESDLVVAYDDPGPPVTRQRERFNTEPDVTDTLIMLRPSIRISERWRFNPTMSYAVDGDSEDHYELSPQFQFQFSDYFALRLGYRSLTYDIEEGRIAADPDDSNYRRFDGDISGAMIGIGWTFPRKPEPVAAAPAPAAPPPAPMAKAPSDEDGDGVIDENDRCPGTPKGTRVGTHGCDCDVTLMLTFAFDSATLTQADKEALVTAAGRLTELKWVTGTAEGHTDSIGSEAYNLSLSERRVKAVVDFLDSQGIDSSRFTIKALGESQPIADNSTEEGRAQNRRVVLKRTDCD